MRLRSALFLIPSLLSVPAFAGGTTDFYCRTELPIEGGGRRPYTEFSFSAIVSPGGVDSDENITMNPPDSLLNLNDFAEVRRIPKGIRLFSDDKHGQVTVVDIFEDGGYREGYALIILYGSRRVYSPITCTSRERFSGQ